VSQVLWFLGYADQALEKSHEAITLAQQQAHPFSLAFALSLAAECHLLRREGQAAQERAEAVLTLSLEQGFAIWLATATMLRGWALAEQGQGKQAVGLMHQGLAATLATGAKLGQPYYLARLAEVCGKVGQIEEGLARLAEALAIVDNTGERHYEGEMHRLKGELTLQQFKVQDSQSKVQSLESEAEACFQKAIAISRRQQAKSLELRAVMSVSRLWQKQGKKKEARKLLAEIYGWFTEGFDTLDLREAKTLLEEVS
jgi:predicted ATPase